jgi:hypothetical protein
MGLPFYQVVAFPGRAVVSARLPSCPTRALEVLRLCVRAVARLDGVLWAGALRCGREFRNYRSESAGPSEPWSPTAAVAEACEEAWLAG